VIQKRRQVKKELKERKIDPPQKQNAQTVIIDNVADSV
jgi:hypothetical protein